MRAVSSEGFLNPARDGPRGQMAWAGGRCLEPEVLSAPKVRYFNYLPNEQFVPDARAIALRDYVHGSPREHLWGSPSWIGRYVKKMPTDKTRLKLAIAMVDIGLLWILLHEEAHFRLGHLHLSGEVKGIRGEVRHQPSSRLSDLFDPVRANHVFEWQADRHATDGIIDILTFEPAYRDLLPDHIKNSWVWILRFAIASIGVVMSAIDVGRFHFGSSKYYPPPSVRFCAVARSAHWRVINNLDYLPPADPNSHFAFPCLALPGELPALFLDGIAGSVWDIGIVLDVIRSEEGRIYDVDPLLAEGQHSRVATAVAFYIKTFELFGEEIDNAKEAMRKGVEGYFGFLAPEMSIPAEDFAFEFEQAKEISRQLDHIIADSEEIWALFEPIRSRLNP